MSTTDIDALCAEQNAWCTSLLAEAERRRAEVPHAPTYSAQEREEHLARTARDLARADVRLERAVSVKRSADRELADATSARRAAHDAYVRAVSRCASAPDTSTPEKENPRR